MLYGFSELTQRILKYGNVQNVSFASHKELNILMYGTPSYVIMYGSYKLLKMVHFFLAHPVLAHMAFMNDAF